MLVHIHPDAITHLVNGDHGSPYDILGPQPADEGHVSIRAFQPGMESLTVVDEQTGERHAMERLHDDGLFEVTIPGTPAELRYHYEGHSRSGDDTTFSDPYAFPLQITDYDIYLFRQGRLLESYDKFGAHPCEINGVKGISFAVWAPNAYRVAVIGDFNSWDSRVHPMQMHGDTGVWELFIPGCTVGTVYRYAIRSHNNGYRGEKSDPYGFSFELRPNNASIVADIDTFTWADQAWLDARAGHDPLKQPWAIYEVHLGSWQHDENGNWLNYRELAHRLVNYAQEMGYTHLELMPITEYPFDGSWGYQATGYYAPTSRYGSPTDFMYFVDYCHQNGIGIILDWVPAHFPKDGYALSYFDGTHLYSHADPRKGEHPDWGTYIFNYGRNEVRNFLLSSALFWLRRYHIDGLRVDAVSSMLYLDFSRQPGQWIPNEYGGRENLDAIAFLREFNTLVHREAPGAVTIAEESTSWPMVSRPIYIGGLGFTFKWNMGWMHDTLDYMKLDPIFRRYHHSLITFALMYAFNENFILSLSHDEVVHLKGSMLTKMSGDWWQKFASLRLMYGFQYTMPGKKLNFMGQEFGQWREWSEERALDWNLLEWETHRGAQKWMNDLNHLYRQQPALFEHDFDYGGFDWIEVNDVEQSVFAYMRFADNRSDFLVVVCNFTPAVRYNYRIGVPQPGFYREILNSDATIYDGSGIGNLGGVQSEDTAQHVYARASAATVRRWGSSSSSWTACPPQPARAGVGRDGRRPAEQRRRKLDDKGRGIASPPEIRPEHPSHLSNAKEILHAGGVAEPVRLAA
ncbi:MAG: 1,4-alpha-glucan branching protein GlgB [Anaerolineae bacterium]